MSHHPQNTGSAIHSAGLTLQAGNNLGNSHLQVFRAGSVCSLTGNEGGSQERARLGNCSRACCDWGPAQRKLEMWISFAGSYGSRNDFSVPGGQLWIGIVIKTGIQRKGAEAEEEA